MPKRQWWWIDPYSCVVVRGRHTVVFGVVQFAIFAALHRAEINKAGGKRARSLTTDELMDTVYHGAVPAAAPAHRVAITKMNRKLQRLGLRICGVNRGKHSFYQLRDLRGVQ